VKAFRWGFRGFNRFFHLRCFLNFSFSFFRFFGFFNFFLFKRFWFVIDFSGLFLRNNFG
jgi:hypothetical protein